MISSLLLRILHEDGSQYWELDYSIIAQKHIRSLLLQSCYNAGENTCRIFWDKAINIFMYFPKEIQCFPQLSKSVFKLYNSSWYCTSILQVNIPIPIACILSLAPDEITGMKNTVWGFLVFLLYFFKVGDTNICWSRNTLGFRATACTEARLEADNCAQKKPQMCLKNISKGREQI